MNPLALAGAITIGLSLGLTGAGGSILTLPVLVYLAGVPPAEAVGLSLFVVGVAAFTGAVGRWKVGDFHWPAAATFGATGMAGAAVGARFTALVPPSLLMGFFAFLMIVVAFGMLRRDQAPNPPDPQCQPVKCILAGGATGILTGFIGVGGGFLLMPALMKFARLPIAMATGTSLAVISLNALIGWIAHLPESASRWDLMGLFALLAVAGTLAGGRLARRLPIRHLRRGFAIMVLVTGGLVLWQTFAN
jgi:uncharacterized membrane protein YfcA